MSLRSAAATAASAERRCAITGASAMLSRPPHRQCRAQWPKVTAERRRYSRSFRSSRRACARRRPRDGACRETPHCAVVTAAGASENTHLCGCTYACTYTRGSRTSGAAARRRGRRCPRRSQPHASARAPAHPTATNTAQPFSHGAARCTRVQCALACALRAAHCAHRVGSFIQMLTVMLRIGSPLCVRASWGACLERRHIRPRQAARVDVAVRVQECVHPPAAEAHRRRVRVPAPRHVPV
jgi:hypothetical protein